MSGGARRGAESRGGGIALRRTVQPGDVAAVVRLVADTGLFSPEENAIAGSLVRERLALGAASGYEFLFAERAEGLAGYTCFGRIPGTRDSFDLYWIAVDPALQGRGIGRQLLTASEAEIRALGGGRIYVDTSGRDDYAPTRAFYSRTGYVAAAFLEDFYAPGDAKVILVKRLTEVP